MFVASFDEHWLRSDLSLSIDEQIKIQARIRYRQPLQNAVLIKTTEGVYVKFDEYQSAITEGQFVAWYVNNELLGSGVIS